MTATPSPSVIPLRIHKHTNSESSLASSKPRVSADSDIFEQFGGPLSEIGLMEGRRNSQSSDKSVKPASRKDECSSSSPTTSPVSAKKTNSPHTFWQNRDLQDSGRNRENSPSVGRRSSIERLKRASRVQNNSKLFQQPGLGSPARPMTYHAAQSAPLGSPFGSPPVARSNTLRESPVDREKSRIPLPASKSPGTPPKQQPAPGFSSPNNRASPTKSSLLSSYKTNSYDADSDGEVRESISRSPVRRPKSVTFDKEAPHVLEYEMVTPDPSIDGSPGGHFDSDEEDDDDDILDNTPVIEPDGWSLMTPERRSSLDDPFQMTPSPTSRPLPPIPNHLIDNGPTAASVGRPLPTVPNRGPESADAYSNNGTGNGTRASNFNDNDGTDGLGITVGPTAEGDLREDGYEHMSPVLLQEGDMSDDEETSSRSHHENEEESSHSSYEEATSDYKAPRLSRESIRRQVQALRHQAGWNPDEIEGDVTEESVELSEEVYVKPEPSEDDGIDMSSIPEFRDVLQRPASRFSTRSPDPDEISEPSTYNGNEDDESKYSDQGDEDSHSEVPQESATPTASQETRLEGAFARLDLSVSAAEGDVGLPDFGSFLGDEGLGLKQYMTPSPPLQPTTPKPEEASKVDGGPSTASVRDLLQTPEEDSDTRSGDDDDTGSVIRHTVYRSDAEEGDEDDEQMETTSEGEDEQLSGLRSPSPVEEAVATIRAPGGKLKTRASATPSDMAAMAAARRQVSGDQSNPPPVPKIPSGYRSEGDIDGSSSDDEQGHGVERGIDSRLSGGSTALPALGEFEFDLNLDDLTDEFDRVIEKQKRGYLMRQNTRVIHASSRDPEDEAPAPNRSGHARGQSWSVEPWRSSQRRRSQREFGRKRPSAGPVPPLPGQESVTEKRLPSVDENETSGRSSLGSTEDDNGERGRLFVKVVGVKDLSLPLPQGQPTYFCLTLDNGLHCVTTSWLELARNAPIGQEFELVVLNELEFQLTLQAKIEQPPPPPPKSAVKAPSVKQKPQKQSTFSKVFSTPKRRKQLEQQQQQQEEKPGTPQPVTAWDLLHGLVARDGSFARSYVCLKDFESKAYGRPFTTDVHCFNEWAIDAASVKSKKGIQSGLQPARKAPYKIGKLELQLFFVPKPKGCQDMDLPKSMNAAIREMRDADAVLGREWEGTLSQQGGDCPFWRRRYFKLNGARLTAYHEATRQPRATINLTKAVKLIDDRNTLVDPTVPGPGKSRRKSGFSEEEEGYMFVEEGFRVRFGNGEMIDFYADSPEDKKGWMKVLGETIGRVPDQRGWVQAVFAQERKQKAERARAETAKMRVPQPQQQQPQNRQAGGYSKQFPLPSGSQAQRVQPQKPYR